MRNLSVVLAGVLLALPAATNAARTPVVVLDPGHDLRASLDTEPIGPGSAVQKIKDGGETPGADREPSRRRALPTYSRRRLDRPERPRDAHALSGASSRLDGRHLRR